MKIIVFGSFLVCLYLVSFMKLYAQENNSVITQPGLKKNVVSGTVGTVPGSWLVLAGSYERMIAERKDNFFNSHWIKASGGNFASWEASGPLIFVGMTSLIGAKINHIELNYGLTLLGNLSSPYYFGPAGALGYRYQKPRGHFVFRAGIGYPEAFFLTLGFAF